MKASKNDGFTLVQLSIVIVIIGFIISGVVAGNALVKQAKIRQALTQLNNYHIATNTFKLTYDALPGDMKNAFAFFGTSGGCTDTLSNLGVHAGCNGNGNRTIDIDGEEQRFWQQLYLAKLISTSYSGVEGVKIFSPGVDVPFFYSENSPKDIIFAGYQVPYDSNVNAFETNGLAIDGTTINIATLTGKTVYAIDAKIDDGKGDTGKIRSNQEPLKYSSPKKTITCYNNTTGVYVISSATPNCTLKSFF